MDTTAHERLSRQISTNTALIITFGVILVVLVVFIIIWVVLKLDENKTARGNKLGCNCGKKESSDSKAITFSINVVKKTSNHPNYGKGSEFGYTVDGKEGPELNLKVGQSYTFVNNAKCDHPLYISTSAIGKGQEIVKEGVYTVGDEPVCDGRHLIFTPTEQQKGKQLYYQCMNHEMMGWKINVQ